jgi:hypothetical protein
MVASAVCAAPAAPIWVVKREPYHSGSTTISLHQ